MLTFGLTGGIATGKSTINKIFTANDIPLVDADIVARQVVEPGTEGLYSLGKEFGAQYINANGSLDRSKLGSLIFKDFSAKSRLDHIMFPLVWSLRINYSVQECLILLLEYLSRHIPSCSRY